MEGQNGRSGLNHLPTTFLGNSVMVIDHGMWENRRYLLEIYVENSIKTFSKWLDG